MSQDARTRRRAATHRRIYEAALRLFGERGWEVPVGEIAAAAGVSVPTFYDHFPSKEHLLMQVPEQAQIDQLVALCPAGAPLADRMRAMILAFLTGMDDAVRADALARWRIVTATPGLRYRAAEFERATAELVLTALQREGTGDDAATRVVVTAHLAAYTEILLRWAGDDGRRPLDDVIEEVLDALRLV